MAYDQIYSADSTSKLIEVKMRSATTGLGLTGLAFDTPVTFAYVREGAAAAANVNDSCATMAQGTWATKGWVEVDATNQPGVYQFGIPNAALAAGAKAVTITFQATGALDKTLKILLDPPITANLTAATKAEIIANFEGRTVYFVSAARSDDTGDGTTWSTAKKIIASAVALATVGGELILVGPGAYNESLDLSALTGVELRGGGWGTRIYNSGTYCVKTGAQCTLADIRVDNTATTVQHQAILIGGNNTTLDHVQVVSGDEAVRNDSFLRLTIRNCNLLGSEACLALYGGSGMVINSLLHTDGAWTDCDSIGVFVNASTVCGYTFHACDIDAQLNLGYSAGPPAHRPYGVQVLGLPGVLTFIDCSIKGQRTFDTDQTYQFGVSLETTGTVVLQNCRVSCLRDTGNAETNSYELQNTSTGKLIEGGCTYQASTGTITHSYGAAAAAAAQAASEAVRTVSPDHKPLVTADGAPVNLYSALQFAVNNLEGPTPTWVGTLTLAGEHTSRPYWSGLCTSQAGDVTVRLWSNGTLWFITETLDDTVTCGWHTPVASPRLDTPAASWEAFGTATGSLTMTMSAATVRPAQKIILDAATADHATAGTFGKAIADTLTHAARLAGITSLANWLRAMFRKSAPDATALAEINDSGGTFSATTDSVEALREKVDNTLDVAISTRATPADITDAVNGPGSELCTITVKDQSGNPLDGVAVWITSDEAGVDVVAGKKYTNSSGQVTFMLDPGTYYCWRQLARYNFTNPQTLVVTE